MKENNNQPKSQAESITCSEKLLSLARDAGRDVDAIESILTGLDSHPLLIELPRILTGFMRVLEAMEIAPELSIEGCDPSVWREECSWIISNAHNARFISRLGPMFHYGDQSPIKNPIIGRNVTSYALPYATLWHEPADSEFVQDYYRLVAQIFVAYQLRSDKQELGSQRYGAYLELRKLCALETLVIPAELKIGSSSSDFAKSCSLFDSSTSIDLLAEHFPPITRLIRYFGGEEPPERNGGGDGHHGPSKPVGRGLLMSQGESEFPLEDPDDPDLLPGTISFIATLPELDDLDEPLPPGELTTQRETWLIDTGNEVRPFVAELLSQQGMHAHIARSRQFLPFGYNLLTLSELANLLFGVTDEFLRCRERMLTASQSAQKPIRLRLEALLSLHLMVWFGRSLEDCKKLRVAERGARSSTAFELTPGDGIGMAEFRIFATSPNYSADEQLPREAVRNTLRTITVPDLVGASSLVMSLREMEPLANGAVFTCKVNAIGREVRALLSELGGGDPRYTMHKVRSYLQRQIIADSHDVVAASMLSGVACLSANTPLFYCQYSVNYLRQLYCKSVQQVLTGVYACVGLAAPITEVPEVAEASVGARNCLRLGTVKSNLEALNLVLRKRPRENLQQIVHWHNCMTLWTVLMFHMATGCRALRNPLKRAAEFESCLRHGALGDKGADDGHMSRLVVSLDMLDRQLRAYEAHCEAICKQLSASLPKGRYSAFGFFLEMADDQNLAYQEIRPRNIRAVMRSTVGFTDHPVNSFRKLLRTEFAERGCSAETLAAFMGHWLEGEEPQDAFSSFCPRTYVQSLHAYLLPLMQNLGWMTRNSHFVVEGCA